MNKIISFILDLINFFRFDIWRITEYEVSRTRKILYRLAKTVIIAVRGFIADRLTIRASALTYSILFAVVPIIALIVAISKGFGVEKTIEAALENTFFAQADMIPTIMGFVDKYLQTTRGGLFIGIGLAILFYSVMNFFMQVENAFNTIWQVKKSRSPIRQFTTYFSAILIVPVLIVLSSGISIFINTTFSQGYVFEFFSPIIRFLVKFSPYFINWLIFTLMYQLIPNTHVKFPNALVAGIIAGTAFQVFQILYINGQINLSRYNVVYGGFAAIPLLLLWLQISCLIVLLGAEISYASQNYQNYEFELDSMNMSERYKNFLILFITYVIVKRFENGEKPASAEEISGEYRLPIKLTNQLVTRLAEVGIIIEVFSESSKTKIYHPAIDINRLTVGLLFNKLETHGSEMFLSNKNKVLDDFWQKASEVISMPAEQETLLVKDI